MSGQPCSLCYRWFIEAYHVHNQRHLEREPHAFCRTLRCGPGCPVPPDERDALARAEDAKGNAAIANGLVLQARRHYRVADAIRRDS